MAYAAICCARSLVVVAQVRFGPAAGVGGVVGVGYPGGGGGTSLRERAAATDDGRRWIAAAVALSSSVGRDWGAVEL